MSSSALQRIEGGQHSTRALAPSQLTPDQVQLIKNTVAKGATDNELQLFLHLAQTYGLDPFAKEIWCIKYGNKAATIFTSRDGYLKIANGHPAFEGIAGDVVRKNDTFEVNSGDVRHAYAAGDRGSIVGAYAQVFRSDRRVPAYVFAPFDEYNAGSNPTWRNYPSAMILKVAEAMALKRAFSISGLVTKEELDRGETPSPAPERKRGRGVRERVRQLDFPGKALVEGPRRQAPPEPVTNVTEPAIEEAEVVEAVKPAEPPPSESLREAESTQQDRQPESPSPDELATLCAQRIELVSDASGETLRAWYIEARDTWPTVLAKRLCSEIDAEGKRRNGPAEAQS